MKNKEMEELYSEKRNTFQLTETSIPIPDDYIKTIDEDCKTDYRDLFCR